MAPRSRPRARRQVQATAPVASDTATIDKSSESQISDGWYWFGMIPSSRPVKLSVPDPNPKKVGMSMKTIDCDPWDLWMGAVDELGDYPIFVPKLQRHQSAFVYNFGFPAFSEAVTVREGKSNQIPFAGCAKRMRTDEVEKIIESCFKHYIRFHDGIENQDTALASSIEFFDIHEDEIPAGMTQDEWERMPKYRQPKTINPHTDIQVADFVYLARFDGTKDSNYQLADLGWSPEGYDARDYRFASNRFHQTICPQITRSFFEKPPKSVAQMYSDFNQQEA